ncbi:MAG: ribonuclease H-like domain-containing protein [Bacteroidetes bacterium]|nr:ribonuclease H-like domain-containing protein [Bacteroidota bacterium]
MISNLLLLDIETVPIVQNFTDLDSNWQQLWIDKVNKSLPENITPENSWKMRGGIMAEFGKIVCISTGYFYEDENRNQCFKIKSIANDDESQLLQDFTELCNKFYKLNKNFIFGGHNIREFDIPYICRRILINNLPLPEYLWLHERKPWEIKMFDTLSWWKFGDNKNYTSLHLLANVLNIPTSKDDIDGSMVQDVYYNDKDLQRIVNYCQKDIVVVANIILKFKHLPLLKESNVILVK